MKFLQITAIILLKEFMTAIKLLLKLNKEYNIIGYNSLDEMLDDIDTLVIVTTTSTHFEIARKALDKNINIFIEKPVTSSLNEAEKLIND